MRVTLAVALLISAASQILCDSTNSNEFMMKFPVPHKPTITLPQNFVM